MTKILARILGARPVHRLRRPGTKLSIIQRTSYFDAQAVLVFTTAHRAHDPYTCPRRFPGHCIRAPPRRREGAAPPGAAPPPVPRHLCIIICTSFIYFHWVLKRRGGTAPPHAPPPVPRRWCIVLRMLLHTILRWVSKGAARGRPSRRRPAAPAPTARRRCPSGPGRTESRPGPRSSQGPRPWPARARPSRC